MYTGVPRSPSVVSAVVLRLATSTARAMPKSATSAWPAWIRMLPGFTSRCTTPRACAKSSASATSAAYRSVSSRGSGPLRVRWSRSEGPSTKGMEYQGSRSSPSSTTPESSTGTMLGWLNFAVMTISRAKRSAPSEAPSSRRSTFTATGRSCFTSRASHTVAMPPSPAGRSIS
jgi:hypothetical protein